MPGRDYTARVEWVKPHIGSSHSRTNRVNRGRTAGFVFIDFSNARAAVDKSRVSF